MDPDMLCIYSSMGSLGALSFLLGFRMSLYRMNDSPGERDPHSDLNKWSLQQHLHAEWMPVGVGLGLALVAKGTMRRSALARNLLAFFAASRWIFTVANLTMKNPKPVMMPAMTAMYATVLGMSTMLLIPSA
jgi:hypothetical protein